VKAGDVILIRSKGVSSLLNRVGQTIVSGRIAPRSHVILCIAPDVVIDATTKHGVMLRNVVREAISERMTADMCDAGTMLAIRPPAASWDPTTGQALVSSMIHIGKKYNWKFGLPNASNADPESDEADSAFCSELVALLLKTWKMLDSKASQTLPISLQRMLTKGAWTDVTAEWAGKLREIGEWAESKDKEKCAQLGGRLWQGNQQIHLTLALKQVGDGLPGWWDQQFGAAWREALLH